MPKKKNLWPQINADKQSVEGFCFIRVHPRSSAAESVFSAPLAGKAL
jgi:hypothetical protein